MKVTNTRWMVVSLLYLAGCVGYEGAPGSDVPESSVAALRALPPMWTLEASGIRVVVKRSPYNVLIQDENGKEILSGLGDGNGKGYGAVGWTSGTFDISTFISPGYFRFHPKLDRWRDQYEVISATTTGTDTLDLLLATPGFAAAPQLRVVLRLRASTLRVEASLAPPSLTASGSSSQTTPPRAWEASFATMEDEGFLGLGGRFGRTNFQGRSMYQYAEEGGIGLPDGAPPGRLNPFPNGDSMTYYPVPFFVSTKGYGFWLDSTYWNQYEFGSRRAEAWRIWHIGPTLAYEVYVPIPGDARPWPYHIIDSFTKATGRPMLPPPWAYGPRRRIRVDATQDGVPEIRLMRELGLPASQIDTSKHIIPTERSHWTPSKMSAAIDAAQYEGYLVNGYANPFLEEKPSHYDLDIVQEALAKNYLILDKNRQPTTIWLLNGRPTGMYTVDFTNPLAVTWYMKSLDRSIDAGFTGWMLDYGEYVQQDDRVTSGMSGEELHNYFPYIFQKAIHDHLESTDLKGKWMTFARSGYTGTSQWSTIAWSGDPSADFNGARGLRGMVRGAINMGVSGVPNWGSDIGGFTCAVEGAQAADGELLTRWIEHGAMTPNMHDQKACVASLDSKTLKADIYSSLDAQQAWRTYARLHTRLFPYFYTLGQGAHETGAPIVRHMFLENPTRPDYASADDAYYLGPSMLVAPVVKRNARSTTIPLPPGEWLDWQSERVIHGGSSVELAAPLSKIPILLRDGHLVPLLDPTIDTLAPETHPTVVGLADVADVYDVVGFISRATGHASFLLGDGGALNVTWTGGLMAPDGYHHAKDESEHATCTDDCWLRTDLPGGLTRVRLSEDSSVSSVRAGGLTVSARVGRRIRWDLYLLP